MDQLEVLGRNGVDSDDSSKGRTSPSEDDEETRDEDGEVVTKRLCAKHAVRDYGGRLCFLL